MINEGDNGTAKHETNLYNAILIHRASRIQEAVF